ncbi:MAG: hypothetical protein E6Q97_27970 [Desulfurellales bacterium]|nr:MAG: hypothetical protein E6Q97_27970 [Desulfurellales bacterium]
MPSMTGGKRVLISFDVAPESVVLQKINGRIVASVMTAGGREIVVALQSEAAATVYSDAVTLARHFVEVFEKGVP